MNKGDWRDYFPESDCLSVIGELAVWASVDDCLAAARFIEQRSMPDDTPSDALLLPFPNDDGYEVVFLQCLAWLAESFRVPESKVKLAMLLDRKITPETSMALLNTRFAPTIAKASRAGDRVFRVTDSPPVIELVQNPIRCLGDLLDRFWHGAVRLRELRTKALVETGGAPTFFHQPYADGPLPALIEALAYYTQGLEIGPSRVLNQRGINRGYRSFEVVDRPPVDVALFSGAREMIRQVFKSLE